jgi:type IV pilus assembly protein PilB
MGLLKEDELILATEQSQIQKKPFVSFIIDNHYIDSTKLATACAHEFGLPLFDINTLDPDAVPKQLNAELVIKYHALPIFKRAHRLFVAISDPTNVKALDEIKYQTNMNTEAILVEEHKLKDSINKVLSAHAVASLGTLEADLEKIDISATTPDEIEVSLGNEAEDAPVVRFINKTLLEAVNAEASDIHFEPYEKNYRVRVRRDGILYEHANPPINLAPRFAARLKVMARLDISERRVPQDGRFKMKISNNRSIDFRVSTCPTLFGEKVVMRILDPSTAQIGIDALGYEAFQKALFLDAIHKPQGLILVTGPTGSGKTVSLYTALNILNQPQSNISTCEDPVEINLSGVNQVHVNLKAGLTFAVALRAFLRQDPDIIMVGEIRDLETAEIAIKAAQTGHLVLSTLHTNSAADTLNRLINMGIPAYNLATSITLVIAQRLARRLCPFCKVPDTAPENALLELGFTKEDIRDATIFAPKGCDKCKDGYKGRTGIYELLPISPAIETLIMEGGHAIALYKQAIAEGMWDLRKSGLHKVKTGVTSIAEINRVIQD